jgi:trk system potassium uptake protein TrkH
VERGLRTRDGFFVVTMLWVGLAIAGAIPLMLGRTPHLSFTDAVFESMSGLTTTGATVLSGIDALPLSVLYYRQQLNWLGGMGIIVLAVAILPMLGIGGMQLYKAEVPGPVKDKLTPRIAETAKALWYIYVGLTVACAVAYWAAGMSPFDAVAHSFSTLSTGGFSTHDASLGYFHSAAIDMVGSVFMILAGINFATHYLAWRNRRLADYWKDPECRFYFGLLAAALAVIVVGLTRSGTLPFGAAFVHGLFQLATFCTNTGLATTAYYHWPAAVLMVLMFMSIVGGCAGSTAGGIKMVRALLLFKQGRRQIFLLVHPQAAMPVKLDNLAVEDDVASAVWGFFAVYMLTFGALMLVLMANGMDQVTAFSAMVATINNLGIGIGGVSSGFGAVDPAAKWALTLSMLMGRLEVFTVLVLFFPEFWRR